MPASLNNAIGLLDHLKSQGKLVAETYPALSAEFSGKPVAGLERALVERHLMTEEELGQVKATGLGMEFVDLVGKTIDPEIMNIVPKSVVENYKVVAFEKEGNQLKIAYVDPLSTPAVEAVGFLMAERNLQAVSFVTSMASYNYILKQYGELKKEVAHVLESTSRKEDEPKVAEEAAQIEETIKGAPVSRIVSVIMRYAVESKASDIHIELWGRDSRVRYRVDGVLRTLLNLPGYLHSSVVSRVKVLASMKLDETRVPQDGRISQAIGGKKIDFRVSTLPIVGGEKVVMRVLDTSKGIPTLEQLGFRKNYLEVFDEVVRLPHGMILVTGPTGSGKSTTLFTLLSKVNEEGKNISTLEDPVEYFLTGANQSQVRPEIKYTFATGLRALLRQDPNIIMVGEIRDQETGELAVHAALTGHLIFSTIHTNDAMGVVPRLNDLGVEPFLLSATLNLIVAQRLARKICEHCKKEVELPGTMIKTVRDELALIPQKYYPEGITPDGPLTFWRGEGCVRCGDTGYIGRTAIAEMILVSKRVRNLMNEGFPRDKVFEELAVQEWLTLRQDSILKVLEGITTMDEVLRLSRE